MGTVAKTGRIAFGYYNDPEKTERTFVTDADGTPWLLTGDLAMVEEDGTIRVFGRGSQCINTGGEKVFPEEVEEALKTHPSVHDVVAVGLPDERFGEVICAVVEPAGDATPDLAELSEHVKSSLAAYKAPRRLVLVDSINRAANGKVDYKRLKEVAAAQV